MSLIPYYAKLNEVNPFDYLTELAETVPRVGQDAGGLGCRGINRQTLQQQAGASRDPT